MGKIARITGIYCIINTKNNFIYIGSSINIKKRWVEHKCALKANNHRNKFLQRSYNKDGINSFTFNVLEELDGTRLKLFSREQYWIDYYIKLGYTLYNGHKKVIMSSLTPEQRKQLSLSHKGNIPWNKGKVIVNSPCNTINTKELYNDCLSGMTIEEMATKYNYNRDGIRQLLNKHEKDNSLSRRKLESKRKILHLTERHVSYILKLHTTGTALSEIAKLYDTTRATLSREICRIRGVKNINELKNC